MRHNNSWDHIKGRDIQIVFFTQKLLRLQQDVSQAFGKEFITLKIAMNQCYSACELNMRKGKKDSRAQQPDSQCLFSCCGTAHEREHH